MKNDPQPRGNYYPILKNVIVSLLSDVYLMLIDMFFDRQKAGRLLAKKLVKKGLINPLVLAIPRGGVVVGKEIARSLDAPLDVFVAKKIGAPGNPESAIGAVGPDDVAVINQDLVQITGASKEYLKEKIEDLTKEVNGRLKGFRKDKPPLEVRGKTVILVDDGIATGATVEVAIRWLRQKGVKAIILAVPVAPPETIERLTPLVEKIICPCQPQFFAAVGQFYEEFPQVSDEEAKEILGNNIENRE